MPWLIGFFLLASVLRLGVSGMALAVPVLSYLAMSGLTLTLFLIGAGLSPRTQRQVGWHPLFQGVLLWLFISAASLGIVFHFV